MGIFMLHSKAILTTRKELLMMNPQRIIMQRNNSHLCETFRVFQLIVLVFQHTQVYCFGSFSPPSSIFFLAAAVYSRESCKDICTLPDQH